MNCEICHTENVQLTTRMVCDDCAGSIPQMQVDAMLMETRREDKARIAELESDLAEARKREQELSEMLAECHAYFVIRNLGSKADALQDQIAKVVNKQEGRGTL